MAQDMNSVMLIGNLVRDVELRKTQSGLSMCTVNIAVNRPKGKDGTQVADFPSITAFGKVAEIMAQYLSKGSKIAVQGRLQTNTYDKDGHRVYDTRVVANEIQFLTPRGQQPQSGPVPTGEVTEDGMVEVNDDALPF